MIETIVLHVTHWGISEAHHFKKYFESNTHREYRTANIFGGECHALIMVVDDHNLLGVASIIDHTAHVEIVCVDTESQYLSLLYGSVLSYAASTQRYTVIDKSHKYQY